MRNSNPASNPEYRDPDDIRCIRLQGVSWAPDYENAVDAGEFWTVSMAIDFDETVYDEMAPVVERTD